MNTLLFINGEWKNPKNENFYPSFNPATEDVLGEVADGNKEDTKEAIDAAHDSLPSWSALTALERADHLMKCYELILERKDYLADLMTREQGKPLTEAKNEVNYAASFFRWFAEEARRIYGETIPSNSPDKRILVIQQPVGVVAAITPWNFPLGMITRKIAPALAAGCTVVVKPAKQTPLNAVALFEIMEEAGMPKGTINLITTNSSKDVGEEILTNPKVKKITFTGSTEVGKYLTREASNQMKRVSMELGGHAPFLIFQDANLEEAVEGVMASKFRNAGQTCVCANRIYVHESIKEEFEQAFAEKVKALKVGNGWEEGVTIGPLIDENAIQKAQEHVAEAVGQGATISYGGERVNGSGTFFEPTILTGVTDEMQISREETFAPVAPITTFKTEEEVIERANNVPFGLAAYLYTQELSRSIRVAEKLEYGVIGLNDALPAVAQAPFGGYKESGVGREGGREGLKDFLETKYISLKI